MSQSRFLSPLQPLPEQPDECGLAIGDFSPIHPAAESRSEREPGIAQPHARLRFIPYHGDRS
jgi:hypothetical protein